MEEIDKSIGKCKHTVLCQVPISFLERKNALKLGGHKANWAFVIRSGLDRLEELSKGGQQ